MTGRRARQIGLLIGLLAVMIWVVALQWGIYSWHGISDLPVYENASRRIADGQLPYRDFALEYPPLAAGLFWLAAALPGTFATGFSTLMLVCLLVTLAGVVASARALNANQGRTVAAALVVACVPLLIGNLVETRFDLAFSAVLAWVLWSALAQRFRVVWILLGIAVALKIVLLVLIPVLAIWHAHQRGIKAASLGLALGASVLGVVLLPFAIVAPQGTWDIFGYHLERPLQLESLGGSYLLGLHALAGTQATITNSFGSQGFVAHGPTVIASLSTMLLAISIAAVAWTFWRLVRSSRREDGPRLVGAAIAATIGATLVFGKVLSPQFMLWLLPVAFLVHHRFGVIAFASGLLAILLTLAYFPHHYWALVALDNGPIAVLALRNLALAVFVGAAWPRAISRMSAPMVHGPGAGDAGDVPDTAVAARYMID